MRSECEPRSVQASAERAIARLAAKHYGVVSRAEALACGVTPSMIKRRVAAALWEPLYPGVYRMAAAPPSWRQALLAACLAWGPGAVISHAAAAALWIFPGFEPGCVELIVPRGRERPHGHTVHRPTPLSSTDVVTFEAIPVTTPARTLFDVAATCSRGVVEEALDDAVRRRIVSIARLQRQLRECGGPGRPGTLALRALVDARATTGVPQSVFETRLLRALKRAGLPAPVLQHEIRSRGRLVARVDFAFPEYRVAVEADGYRWHSSRRRWEHDLGRRNLMTALGWRVVHVTWEDLRCRPEHVLHVIAALLSRDGGPPGTR